MSAIRECIPWPWIWEQCKKLWWGSSHATQSPENGTADQTDERSPLLTGQRAQATTNETHDGDVNGASSSIQGPPATQNSGTREPSFSFQRVPPSRENTLQFAPDFETPTPSREERSDIIVSTGYSQKLDIPKALAGVATHTEDTNVLPSSIHSSGSIRLPELSTHPKDGELSGVGQKFDGDQSRHHEDDSSDQLDEELEPQQRLEDQLLDQLIEWPKDANTFFIPIDQQKRLVTPRSIRRELKRVEDKENRLADQKIEDVSQQIWANAPKLFSILVCLGKSRCIFNFMEEKLDDDDLPFVRTLSETNANGTGASRFKLSSRRTPKTPIKYMANWSRNDITGFARDQWWMLAPVFKESSSKPRKVRHYELDDMCVMPFIEDHEQTNTVASGFSTVWAVRIHPAHQLFNTSNPKKPNPLIALKKLNSTDEKLFKQEVEMLEAFSSHKDRHLIKLLATYRIKNRYHLMFPYCQYNLRTYWEANPKPKFTLTTVRWFLWQCKGIAHGLMTIHVYKSPATENTEDIEESVRGYHRSHLSVNSIPVKESDCVYGRHGKLKPENILWSDDTGSDDERSISQDLEQYGLLVITDFGLMDFHGKQSRSTAPADTPASLTYTPPELRLKTAISRAYDIWSLGCVYLEFVTWLVAWWDEPYRFANARGLTGSSDVNDDFFYTIIEEKNSLPRAIVRESVIEWMKDLHEKARCSQFIHDFVDLISEEMLVVEQNERIHCGPLNDRLNEMCSRSQDDPGYLTDPKPYPPRERNLIAQNISGAGRLENKRNSISPPGSPTATEGEPLPKRYEIPSDLDTETKSVKYEASTSALAKAASPANLKFESLLSTLIERVYLASRNTTSSSSKFQVNYQIQWEVPIFLKTRFTADQSLGDVLTITGDFIKAEATSCRNYITRTWPRIGNILLDSLENLFLSSKGEIRNETRSNNEETDIELYHQLDQNKSGLDSEAQIIVRASKDIQFQIASALAWICSTVRSSPNQGPSLSSTLVTFIDNETLLMSLGDLTPLKSFQACWNSLFSNVAISAQFLPRARNEGLGLEISFVDMIGLTGSLALIEVNKGLFLDGLSAVVYPTKHLASDDAIQWHLKLKSEDKDRITAHHSQSMPKDWYKILDSKTLASSRLFLGWTLEAHVKVGSDSSLASNIQESGAYDSTPSTWVRSFGASIGIGYKGLANLALTVSATRTAVPSGISAIEEQNKRALKNALANAVNHQVIIYDDDEQIAWLIPHSSLILFLAQVYLLQNKDSPLAVLPDDLYCSSASDGGKAALDQLQILIGSKGNWPRINENFEQLLRITTHNLGLVQDEIRKIYNAHINAAPKRILGVELVHVALRQESMPVKNATVRSPWAYFTAHEPCFVLFCKNLGQAIVPSSHKGLCSNWLSVPSQKNYLVSTGHSILSILRTRTQRGISRLADRILWDLNVPLNPLVKIHPPGKPPGNCQHLQWLAVKKESETQHEKLHEIISTSTDGGYIFGNRDHWLPSLGKGEAIVVPESSSSSLPTNEAAQKDEKFGQRETLKFQSSRVQSGETYLQGTKPLIGSSFECTPISRTQFEFSNGPYNAIQKPRQRSWSLIEEQSRFRKTEEQKANGKYKGKGKEREKEQD